MSSDNIAQPTPAAEPTLTEPTAEPASAPVAEPAAVPVVVPPPEFFNLGDALRMIAKYYERDFPKLTFSIPAQIIDGCVMEFVDGAMSITVASARVRVRNRLIVNNENGDMFLQVHLSDLAFSRSSVPVVLK